MDEPEGDEDVTVSMEISGEYEDVLSKLKRSEPSAGALGPLVSDLETLLETVVPIDGGTRSAIAEQVPAGTTVEFDPEAVVDTLQVLERYGLVVVEGNTWKPGPRLER